MSLIKKIVWVCLGVVFAQIGKTQQMPYRHFTIHDGLPQSQIQYLCEDNRGYIWIATYDGIAYCDGTRIHNLTKKMTSPDKLIGCVAECKDGNLYFQTRTGFNRFNGKNFEKDTLGFRSIDFKFVIDNENKQWAINKLDSQLYCRVRFGQWENVHQKVGFDSSHKCYNLLYDEKGQRLLIQDYNNFIYELSQKGKQNKLNFQIKIPRYNPPNSLLFIRSDSIFQLEKQNLQLVTKTNSREIHHVVEYNEKYYYIHILDHKLFIVDKKGKKDSLDIEAPINLLHKDKHNRIWAGTENGLFCFFPNGFYSFDKRLKNTWSIVGDKNDKIFFGSFFTPHTLMQYSKGKLDSIPGFHRFSKSKEGLGSFYFGGATDLEGNSYFPMNSGVMKYDGKKFSRLNIGTQPYPNTLAMNIFISRDKKRLYICTFKGIIVHTLASGSNDFIEMYDDKSLNKLIFAGCEDIDGNIWGSSAFLIFCYNLQTKTLKSFNLENITSFYTIESDNSGNIWAGHSTGLLRLHKGDTTFQSFLPKVFFSNIQSVLNYKDKILVIGVLDGVILFDLENFNRSGKIILKKYNQNNGFTGIECNQNTMYIDGRDILYVGATNTVYTLDLKTVDFNIKPPNVYIVEINNERVPYLQYGKMYELAYNINNVKLKFETVGEDQSTGEEYSYRIDDGEWSPWLSENYAFIENLSSGIYHFSVRTRLLGNPDESQYAKTVLELIVRLPFYREPYFPFYAGLILSTLIMFIGYGFYDRKRNFKLAQQKIQLVEQEQHLREVKQTKLINYLQIQTLQSQLNPHFIFNVLDVVYSKIKENSTELAGKLILDLSKLIRRFLESSINMEISSQRSEHTLQEELNLLESYIQFEKLQYPDMFDYNIEVAEELDKENTYIPPMLLQPYIENAIKHGLMYKKNGKGELKLRIYPSSNESLIYEVTDNGVGREKAKEIQENHLKMYKSRGTEIVEKRVKIMQEMGIGITISTENLMSGGTKITIEIEN